MDETKGMAWLGSGEALRIS